MCDYAIELTTTSWMNINLRKVTCTSKVCSLLFVLFAHQGRMETNFGGCPQFI